MFYKIHVEYQRYKIRILVGIDVPMDVWKIFSYYESSFLDTHYKRVTVTLQKWKALRVSTFYISTYIHVTYTYTLIHTRVV